MKLGFNEATCMKRSSVEQDLALCEKYGYDYIELRLDMLKTYLKTHTLADLQRFFQNSRLSPWALNSIEDVNFNGPEAWTERVDLFRFGCEVAQAIENPYIIIVPTMRDDMRHKTKEAVRADSVAALRRLADIGAPYGVKLAFEPIGDPRWCVRSLAQALEIVAAVDRPDVGLALDSINLFLYDRLADIDAIDEVPPEKLFVYHINDCEDLPLGELDHCHRLMPGDGVIPLQAIREKLRAKDYDGSCAVELFRPAYWDMAPEDVIRIAAEKTRPFL
jgi:2-keto-myo-inositol isomerase